MKTIFAIRHYLKVAKHNIATKIKRNISVNTGSGMLCSDDKCQCRLFIKEGESQENKVVVKQKRKYEKRK